MSGPWVFGIDQSSAGTCASGCASTCASALASTSTPYINARAALFRSVQPQTTSDMCIANTITITWSDTDLADVTANEAGTVTYGGDVRTPVKAQTKKGKTFAGWLFSTTAPTE